MYKKLKGLKSTLDDLSDLQPDLARGLHTLLDYVGDVQSTFGFVFQISYEVFGEIRTIDLKPNGGDIAVTNVNREE